MSKALGLVSMLKFHALVYMLVILVWCRGVVLVLDRVLWVVVMAVVATAAAVVVVVEVVSLMPGVTGKQRKEH